MVVVKKFFCSLHSRTESHLALPKW